MQRSEMYYISSAGCVVLAVVKCRCSVRPKEIFWWMRIIPKIQLTIFFFLLFLFVCFWSYYSSGSITLFKILSRFLKKQPTVELHWLFILILNIAPELSL